MTFTILPESPPAPSSRRPSVSRQTIAMLAAAAVLVAGAAVYLLTRGSAAPTATSPTTATAPVASTPQTAAQWLSAAMTAARLKGSVHVEVLNKLHGRIGRYSDDDGAGIGVQRITIQPGMKAQVRVAPGMTYFVANRAALANYFGFPADLAARAAGRWIALRPGQPGYKQVTEGVTFLSTMKEMTIRGPLTLLPARTVRGVKVVGIRGTAGGHAARHGGKVPATLWVRADASHLPVLYEASSRRLGSTTTYFSRWGMKVDVVTPSAL